MPRPQRHPDPGSLIGHFGSDLRRRRTMADLSMAQLAAALGCSPQWIGTVEQGDKPPSEPFSQDLDTYFQTAGAFHHLWKSIKRANRNQVLLPGFFKYLELEAKATIVRAFVAQLIPGLLPTEAYARAVMNADEHPATLDERVAGRLERQEIFCREKPPKALFVLDEAVFGKQVGGPLVMREQLRRLVQLAESPSVQLRALPYSSVTYAGLDGMFTILGFDDGSEVAYHEGPGTSYLSESQDMVGECALRFDLVMGEALPRAESLRVIVEALENLT